jgi:hypothetical protein
MAMLSKAVKGITKMATTSNRREGQFTKMIENQTAKIPSVFFLSLGLASIAVSAGIALMGEEKRKTANFIGLWVPTILILGLYNKIVKLEGNDQHDR